LIFEPGAPPGFFLMGGKSFKQNGVNFCTFVSNSRIMIHLILKPIIFFFLFMAHPAIASTGIFQFTQGKIEAAGDQQKQFEFYPNGQLKALYTYESGVLHGFYLLLDQKGYIIEQGYYATDQLDGKQIQFQQGGRISMESHYKNGEMHGLRTTYYEKGGVQERSNFEQGLRHGSTFWYNTKGQLVAEYNYKNGFFDGFQRSFHPCGKLKSQQYFIANKQHGESIEYHENGQKRRIGQYVDGRMTGEWRNYDQNGKLLEVINHSHE
jgi:uncharacterized protein